VPSVSQGVMNNHPRVGSGGVKCGKCGNGTGAKKKG